jgi:hypothetical protein
MKQSKQFNFTNRLGKTYWRNIKENEIEQLYGDFHIHWTAEVVSSQGAHYHFWISPELENRPEAKKAILTKCEILASFIGDPVSFSYDYIEKQDETHP